MVFRSKVDSKFKQLFIFLMVFLTVVMVLPIFIDSNVTQSEIIILLITYALTISLIIWVFFGPKYTLREHYLIVQGGPFRSKIKYSDITKIAKASELLTGYRLATSTDALEVFYKTATMGSVKISPYEQDAFLVELKQRCPNIKYEI